MFLKYLKPIFRFDLVFIIIIFFLDRISKFIVINYYEKNLTTDIFNSKFLNIYLIWNKGIGFGLFSFDEVKLYNFLTILISLVIFFILFLIYKSSGIKKFALLMIFGGALGNLYDRIVYRAVPDFIDFHIQNFHWFIFNVSDIFITLGVIFLIFLEFFYKKEEN